MSISLMRVQTRLRVGCYKREISQNQTQLEPSKLTLTSASMISLEAWLTPLTHTGLKKVSSMSACLACFVLANKAMLQAVAML